MWPPLVNPRSLRVDLVDPNDANTKFLIGSYRFKIDAVLYRAVTKIYVGASGKVRGFTFPLPESQSIHDLIPIPRQISSPVPL